MSTRLKTVPNFLRAASPQGLRRLMLLNNIRKGKKHYYFDFTETTKGEWLCWFEEEVKVKEDNGRAKEQ